MTVDGGDNSHYRLLGRTFMINDVKNLMQQLGFKLIEWKTSKALEGSWEGTQFKARADTMAHDYLIDKLVALTPGIPVLSEEDESGLTLERPDKYWLIGSMTVQKVVKSLPNVWSLRSAINNNVGVPSWNVEKVNQYLHSGNMDVTESMYSAFEGGNKLGSVDQE